MPPVCNPHAKQEARTYLNLSNARQKASRTLGYDSAATRANLIQLFQERFGGDPYDWQLDVTEAILLGLDTVVIAGTGAGKTMPFVMPLLLDEKKKAIVISPLKILQADQAERFQKLKVSAVAVNSDTWDAKLQKELENNTYQGIFASPEMCLKHDGFRNVLTSSNFQDITAIIVDEAHSFFPPHIPIFATSATLPPAALREVCGSLAINVNESFFLNLGNDRPNIAFYAQQINSSTDYKALRPHLSHCSTAQDLIKSIIFTNSVNSTQLIAKDVRSWLPKHLRKYVGYLHANRTPEAKRKVMKYFRKSKLLVLIATEAAGMGADIPDIEQVIQFGVPLSLTIWMQRAGRAGRSQEVNARAILLFEKSIFQRQKKKCHKGKTDVADPTPEDDQDDGLSVNEGNDDDEGNTDEEDKDPSVEDQEVERDGPKDDDSHYEWRKKVEHSLQRWIETEACRRDVADEYFSNPPGRKVPTHVCCDNCDGIPVRPSTPERVHDGVSSTHSTPSKSADQNGKRKMTTKQTTARRGGEHLQQARTALESWRFKTKRARYTPSSLTVPSLLPDAVLTTLASALHLRTIEDIESAVTWVYARRHGTEILAVLAMVDQHKRNRKEEVQAAKALERRSATEARQRERKRAQEVEREERKHAHQAEREEQQMEKLAAVSSTSKPPRKRCAPVQGSSVMALESPLTPVAAMRRVALGPVQICSPLPDPGMFLQFQTVPLSSTASQPQSQSQPLVQQLNSTENCPVTPSSAQPRPRPRPLIPRLKGVENPPITPSLPASESQPLTFLQPQPRPLI
ncbi:P-loop containing nucleoside triphosphate hydrolase protein [Phlegmacium glaucopus]|nr:P-loop containing nucleoside triphosphate hydrolase protein [Phlegmacium glaucopus]